MSTATLPAALATSPPFGSASSEFSRGEISDDRSLLFQALTTMSTARDAQAQPTLISIMILPRISYKIWECMFHQPFN